MITTKHKLTLHQLQRVPLTKPADAGEAWQGIRHAELLKTVHAACTKRGWECSLLGAALSPDQADLAASLSLKNPHGEFRLGVLSSNARRFALRFFLGKEETMPVAFDYVASDVFVGRLRHSEMRPRIDAALNEVDELSMVLDVMVAFLPKKVFTLNESNALYLNAARRKILPWSHIRYVELALQQFADPSNAWSFFGAFNRALSHAAPLTQLPKRLALFQLFLEACGRTKGGK